MNEKLKVQSHHLERGAYLYIRKEVERSELMVARQTVKAQGLTIEKLEYRLARLLRVQFGRSSEKMDIAQLRLMFEDIDTPEPAKDDVAAEAKLKSARKAGARAPIAAHIPRLTAEHCPEPCGCGGAQTVICEDVTEVLDYVPARFRVLRHVRPRIALPSARVGPGHGSKSMDHKNGAKSAPHACHVLHEPPIRLFNAAS
jgi:hypothetical protein